MIAVESGSEECGRAGRRGSKMALIRLLKGGGESRKTYVGVRYVLDGTVGTRGRRRSNRDLSLDLWVCRRVSGGWWELICRRRGGVGGGIMKEGGRAMVQRDGDIGITSDLDPVPSRRFVARRRYLLEVISLNDSNCVASPGNTTSRGCKGPSVVLIWFKTKTPVEVQYPGGRYRYGTLPALPGDVGSRPRPV